MFGFLEKLLKRDDASKDVLTFVTSYRDETWRRVEEKFSMDLNKIDPDDKARAGRMLADLLSGKGVPINGPESRQEDFYHEVPEGAKNYKVRIERNGKTVFELAPPNIPQDFYELRQMAKDRQPAKAEVIERGPVAQELWDMAR